MADDFGGRRVDRREPVVGPAADRGRPSPGDGDLDREAQGLPHPRRRLGRLQIWTDDQLINFLTAPLVVEDRYHAGYWLGAYPGLRLSEVLGLQWKHIDLDGSAVQVVQQLARRNGAYVLKPKLKVDTDGEWRVIWPEAVEALRVHKERRMAEVAAAGVEWSDEPMVFMTEKGMPVDTASWWKHFQLLARKLGLPRVKPHSFRHKAATTDNRAGVDPNTRMLQRGRVSMESERVVYIHPELRDQHVAADASHRVFFERRRGDRTMGGDELGSASTAPDTPDAATA